MKNKNIVAFTLMMFLYAFAAAVLSADEEKPSLSAYGFIKMEAIYETGAASHGNFAIWAKDPGDNDGLFHLTAKETRFGLNMTGVSFSGFKVAGKLEVDFQSAGVDENKPYNYMRHAYVEISNGVLSILAGQSWDIISPLNPVTLNYPVMWGAGNIGYRRPQLSLRTDFKTGKNVITLQAGIFRTIASDYDNDGIEDGAAAGFPTIQGRIGGKFLLGDSSSLQIGLSGHYGKSKGQREYVSDSLNLDLLLVLSPKFRIIAEYFSGQNLGTYFGGIAQNVTPALGVEIKARGFYINAVASLCKKLQFSAGYGVDDPDDATLGGGARSWNATYFGNLMLSLSPALKAGLEVSNWLTDYKGAQTRQKTLRFQHSWIFSF